MVPKPHARAARNERGFDVRKFENVQQIGGIRTGTLDYPNPGGGSRGCRVAHVNTGSGLQFTVALDRGGDLVEASYRGLNLAFLTPNDYKPPTSTDADELAWLTSWPGGLLTTCGAIHMGEPREEDGMRVSLHGRHSNTPAALEQVNNPDPSRGIEAMSLVLSIRDTRMFCPNLEVRRRIACRLGESVIEIEDEVINRGDLPCPHALLYHVNFGYPFLNTGAELIFRGPAELVGVAGDMRGCNDLNRLKTIPGPLKSHAGAAETVLTIEPPADKQGLAHVGIINEKLTLGVELTYPVEAMPRLANWQHFGPRGSYVTALEPFSGSIIGKARDEHSDARQQLLPGESKSYALTLTIHDTPRALARLRKHNGPLRTPR